MQRTKFGRSSASGLAQAADEIKIKINSRFMIYANIADRASL